MNCQISNQPFSPKALHDQNDVAGLLTRSPFERLPIRRLADSDQRLFKKLQRAYSSGYCSGFTPDSLLPYKTISVWVPYQRQN